MSEMPTKEELKEMIEGRKKIISIIKQTSTPRIAVCILTHVLLQLIRSQSDPQKAAEQVIKAINILMNE